MNEETIPGLARREDPETSHEAAKSVDATQLIERIYKAMLLFGDEGCITDDVEAHLPDVFHQSLTPRFRQMLDRGMIEYTGEKRKSAKSGRLQLVRRCLPKPFQTGLALRSAKPNKWKDRCAELETGKAFDKAKIAELKARLRVADPNVCTWCGVAHNRGENTLCPLTIAEATIQRVRDELQVILNKYDADLLEGCDMADEVERLMKALENSE